MLVTYTRAISSSLPCREANEQYRKKNLIEEVTKSIRLLLDKSWNQIIQDRIITTTANIY